MLYTKINVKFNHFLFLTSSESPLNKGGSEGVWKYRWLLEIDVKEETNGTKYFLKSVECDDTLMLASEKARQTFLSIIETEYCEGMDIEGYYAYHHAMEKDD